MSDRSQQRAGAGSRIGRILWPVAWAALFVLASVVSYVLLVIVGR